MSIYNAAGALSGELGSILTSSLNVTESNFDNLSLLVIICALSSLLTLPFIGLLDKLEDKNSNVEDITKPLEL